MSHIYSIGVNGGGTHVTARIIDANGRALPAIFEAGAVNPRTVGIELAAQRINDVILRAIDALERGDTIDVIACGIAGTADPTRRDDLTRTVASSIGRPCIVVTDVEAALAAAAESGPAMVLIAGTGSIALMRNGDGALVRAGGLGHSKGDPGSATRIGHDLIAIEEHVPEVDRREILDRRRSGAMAALAPIADRLAVSGHARAQKILDDAADALFALVLELAGAHGRFADGPKIPLGLHGGVIEHSERVRSAVLRKIIAAELPIMPFLLETPPEVGAVRAAKSNAPRVSPGSA